MAAFGAETCNKSLQSLPLEEALSQDHCCLAGRHTGQDEVGESSIYIIDSSAHRTIGPLIDRIIWVQAILGEIPSLVMLFDTLCSQRPLLWCGIELCVVSYNEYEVLTEQITTARQC